MLYGLIILRECAESAKLTLLCAYLFYLDAD